MLRGGSWNNNPENCRSACRNNNNPDNDDNNNIGFRLVCGIARSALLYQSRRMGMRRACQRRVQTCSCGIGESALQEGFPPQATANPKGDDIRKSNRVE
ncbi:MAG: hypothetical protein AAFX80_07530 [Cyanobacteria bacterium J06639_18]